MNKLLFLPGYACTSDIWDDIKTEIIENGFNADYADWPKEKLSDFNTTFQFAKWVNKQYDLGDYSTIIGHSMGGLVAIDLAKENLFKGKRLILVESFLKTPSKFFRNLYLEDAQRSLKERVETMLKEESSYYSKDLSEKLKNLDITAAIANMNAKIFCIYGARDQISKEFVVDQLNIDKKYSEKLSVKIVSQCAHFPMLESPEKFMKELVEELV